MAALTWPTGAEAGECTTSRKRYEFIPLGTLSTSITPDSFAYAINNLGEIVGAAETDSFSLRATLWMYCPNYHESLSYDLNLDGEVNGGDLGIVLGDWDGTCELPCGAESAMHRMGGYAEQMAQALAVALASLGFESVASYNEWAKGVEKQNSDAILAQLAALLTQ